MWFKLCLLLIYITVLFILARLVEALTWYETGSLSRRLLDPMTLSVAKLKALLEQRGVSYDTVVEKGELTQLVEASGSVHEDEVELLQTAEESDISSNTNFTSGAHFYEQVEDAKDSVWLVQVLADHHAHHAPFSEATWKSIRKKVAKFGINTGVLDCDLDPWWCERRGWHSSHLLLALPQVYQQKANVATYTYQGPLRQNALARWMRLKLQEKIETIQDFRRFKDEWLTFKKGWQESEVRVLFFTDQDVIPMFFSALSVKFPGRVRFGVVKHDNSSSHDWAHTMLPDANFSLPVYVIVTNEKAYIYGKNQGDCLTFSSMETLLKFLHPCLNDIFIFSFLVANLASVLELVTAQGRFGRRLRRFLWCIVKYNAAVIMLWLPLIAMFQLPYLDHFPLLGLKFSRTLATSSLGEALRRDVFFYSQHMYVLVASFVSACAIFGVFAYKMTGGRYEDDDEPWFNFAQMRTLTHLRSNEFFEPMSIGGYDLSGGMEIFGSRLYLPTMSLQPVVSPQYVSLLPTWPFCKAPKTQCSRCYGSNQQSQEKISTEEVEGIGCVDTKEFSAPASSMPSSSLSGDAVPGLQSPCRASANDLLDGNYHCECEEHSLTSCLQPQSLPPHHHHLTREGDFTDSTPSQNPQKVPSSADCKSNLDCSSCLQKQSPPTMSPPASLDNAPTKLEEEKVGSCCSCSDAWGSSAADVPDFPAGYLSCSQCVICLEEYSVGVTLCGLPCSHVFHHSCILTWLQRDHHFCPVCRWPSFRPRPQVVHPHSE